MSRISFSIHVSLIFGGQGDGSWLRIVQKVTEYTSSEFLNYCLFALGKSTVGDGPMPTRCW